MSIDMHWFSKTSTGGWTWGHWIKTYVVVLLHFMFPGANKFPSLIMHTVEHMLQPHGAFSRGHIYMTWQVNTGVMNKINDGSVPCTVAEPMGMDRKLDSYNWKHLCLPHFMSKWLL